MTDDRNTYRDHRLRFHVDPEGLYVRILGPEGPKSFTKGGRAALRRKAKAWIDKQLDSEKRSV